MYRLTRSRAVTLLHGILLCNDYFVSYSSSETIYLYCLALGDTVDVIIIILVTIIYVTPPNDPDAALNDVLGVFYNQLILLILPNH